MEVDIIGDIHGQGDALWALASTLGYDTNGGWSHGLLRRARPSIRAERWRPNGHITAATGPLGPP